MSRLNRLARAARGILRNTDRERTGGLGTRRPGQQSVFIEKPPIEPGQSLLRRLRRKAEQIGIGNRLQEIDAELLRRPAPPPVFTPEFDSGGLIPPPFPSGKRSQQDEWINEYFRRRQKQQEIDADEQLDEIQVLGRGYDYDEDDFNIIRSKSTKVESSNVYSYYWQPESKTSGILYVTFLQKAPSKFQQRSGAGATYAYYGVTTAKYRRFRSEAASSPGKAVWDHLRVRGTIFGHQVQYRLVAVSGDYVPRKATKKGFKTRYLKPVGSPQQVNARLPKGAAEREKELARRGFLRSTLPAQEYSQPERGNPDRGQPNRG